MNKLTQEQKQEFHNHGKSLGIDDNTMKLLASEFYRTETNGVMDLTTARDFIACTVDWSTSEQGYEFWSRIYDAYSKPEEEVFLTQADIQSLLHVVRDTLRDVTYNKQHSSAVASEYWAKSEQGNPETSTDFHCFSVHNKYTKKMKAREKKLVHLIKRLKGLQ